MANRYWIRKLFIFWELPQFVLGLFFLIFLSFRKSIKKRLKFGSADFFFAEKFPGGISLSSIIILNKIECHLLNSHNIKNRHSIVHEYGHSIQSLYLGWFYLPLVGLPSLIRSIMWSHGRRNDSDYYKRYPESWADRVGKKYI